MNVVLAFHKRRIVVAREEQRAQDLLDYLRSFDADAVALPLTMTSSPLDGGEALREAATRANDYDWLLLSSARAVVALDDFPTLREIPHVAVVGPATAEALASRGLEAALIASGTGGVELAHLLLDQETASGRMLFVGAQSPAGGLVDELREAGRDVDVVASYATIPRPVSDAEVETLKQSDIIIVSAPSAVHALSALLGPHSCLIVATGPTTAQAARSAGFKVFEADTPDLVAVSQAVEAAAETLG